MIGEKNAGKHTVDAQFWRGLTLSIMVQLQIFIIPLMHSTFLTLKRAFDCYYGRVDEFAVQANQSSVGIYANFSLIFKRIGNFTPLQAPRKSSSERSKRAMPPSPFPRTNEALLPAESGSSKPTHIP